jgi:hypothetical protein
MPRPKEKMADAAAITAARNLFSRAGPLLARCPMKAISSSTFWRISSIASAACSSLLDGGCNELAFRLSNRLISRSRA